MLSYAEAGDFCRKATELMRAAKLIESTERNPSATEAEWVTCAHRTDANTLGDDALVSDQ